VFCGQLQTVAEDIYFHSTSVFSALDVATRMRYINSLLTLTLDVAFGRFGCMLKIYGLFRSGPVWCLWSILVETLRKL